MPFIYLVCDIPCQFTIFFLFFVSFSHNTVTVPPSGWINAAHRQGVKMLGTLIFEGSGEQDCLRLLVGHLPQARTGPVIPSADSTFPVSMHYARLLADLAYQRGFDGYLLNFECPLRGGVEQTRALSVWVSMLQSELRSKVGPHSEVIWYDSVIITGQLRWQDRLNALNLPFFLSSTSFFTNYTWPPHYPSLTAQYFLSLDPALISADAHTSDKAATKSLRDLFVGVDVWGRGSHGNGGFGSYKAISHIDPEFLGLSVALFGQAWTWESEQDKPGWNWDKWWDYERKLWIGPEKEGEVIEVPEPPKREPGEPEPPPECPHGPFQPMCDFFPSHPPPNPAALVFYTSFSAGVGRAWFVNGVKVLQTENGWTDVDKQCSLGDMVWPRPKLAWEDVELDERVPDASSAICMDDAWIGGSSLRLSVSCQGSDAEDAFFRCIWLPVQSLAITSARSYEADLVYKVYSEEGVDLDIGLSAKLLADIVAETIEVTPTHTEHLSGGWIKTAIQFSIPKEQSLDILTAIGLVVGFASEDPLQSQNFSILIGQLCAYPSPTPNLPTNKPKILWVDFKLAQPADSTHISGTLTWEAAVSFVGLTGINITSPEDPQPAWRVDYSRHWLPSFLYFNVYAQAHQPDGSVLGPEFAIFLGTNGLDGRGSRLFIDAAMLPDNLKGSSRLRFYVQGVTNCGTVLPWEQCAFVDFIAPNA